MLNASRCILTDQVAVAGKATLPTGPTPFPGLVLVPAARTPVGGPSFRAGEARDARLFGFVDEGVEVTPVLPLGHTPVMLAARVTGAHIVRVADEQAPNLVFDAEVDDLARGLVPQITHAPLVPVRDPVLVALELLPAPRTLRAAALFFGKLPELLTSLPFETEDTATRHDSRLAGRCGHGGQVNFPRSAVACTAPGSASAWCTSMHTCSPKHWFQTSMHAPAFSGRTMHPFSRWTAWAGHPRCRIPSCDRGISHVSRGAYGGASASSRC